MSRSRFSLKRGLGLGNILAIVLFSFWSWAEVIAQNPSPNTFYLLTYNQNAETETVWEVNTTEGSSRNIFTINNILRESPRTAFPESEFDLFEEAITAGAFPARMADLAAVGQNIAGIWSLDSEHLLVLTIHHISNVYWGYLFGYYEFLILNIPDGSLTSLTKLAYHNVSLMQSWGCEPTFTTLSINSVIPNPVSSMFAFTVTANHQWCANQLGQTYLVDYSLSPSEITEIAGASEISWSPDGTFLAYITRDICETSRDCPVKYYVLPVSTGSEPVLIIQYEFSRLSPAFISWTDSQTVLYQYDLPPTENPLNLAWYDVVENNTDSIQWNTFDLTHVDYLQANEAHLLVATQGAGWNAELLIMRFTDDLEIVDRLPLRQRFYNSKFNQYLFLGLGGDATTVLDAYGNLTPLDLSLYLPPDQSETVYYLAPGPLPQVCQASAPSQPPTFTVAPDDTVGLINAINAANANVDPDIILLEGGTYTLTTTNNSGMTGRNGLPVINTDITLYGNCSTITRNTSAKFRIFYVDTQGTLTLYDTTVSGGDHTIVTNQRGGGVYSRGNLNLIHSTVTGNSADYGGGVYLASGSGTITNSTIADNFAQDDGGGIYNALAMDGTLEITDSRISGNQVNSSGGGMFNAVNSTTTFSNSVLENNQAGWGGGAYVQYSTLSIENGSTVNQNTASSGGGLYASSSTVSIASSTFSANTVYSSGGALYVYMNSQVSIADSTLADNTATMSGGALYSSYGSGGQIDITSSTLTNNQAETGAGVYLENDSRLTLTGTSVTGNTATGSGGGVFVESSSFTVNEASAITGNNAYSGGGIDSRYGQVSITDSVLSSNTANEEGRAIRVYATIFNLSNSEVSGNNALAQGGGLCIDGYYPATITSVVFLQNHASSGGGIYTTNEETDIATSTFSANSADSGGGVYNGSGSLSVVDSVFSNNTAEYEGGGLLDSSGDISAINNSCLTGNTAPDGGGVMSYESDFDATNNWWGAADGPSGAGSGTGDAVNAKVLFTPFLTEGCPVGN